MRLKRELLRLVRAADGRTRVDWRGREPGRGSYVCPDQACLDGAFGRGRLGHAFKQAAEPPVEGTAEILAAWREMRMAPARAE